LLQIHQKNQNGQLCVEWFHVSFHGILDPDNLWVLFHSLIPLEQLQETYAPHSFPRLVPLQSLYGWDLMHFSSSSGLA
jgi:hypothetical protein